MANPQDWPSKSEVYGNFNTLSDRLDALDLVVDAAAPTAYVDAEVAAAQAAAESYADVQAATVVSPVIRRPAGRWGGPELVGTIGPVAGRMWVTPILWDGSDVDGFALEVATAANAGAVLRLFAYLDDGGAPGDLLVDGGTIPFDSTGQNAVTFAAASGATNILWVGAVAENWSSGGTFASTGYNSAGGALVAAASGTNHKFNGGYILDGAPNRALPAAWGVSANLASLTARVFARAA